VLTQPLFEAYRLLHSTAPKTDRLKQVLTLLRLEIEQDGGCLIYEDPATAELRLIDGLAAPAKQANPRRATRGTVLAFRKRRR
jgi:hypothetical protein